MVRTRSIVSSVIGNALEFYDTSLVMVYALTLSDLFFPKTDSTLLSLYRGIGVFALGMVIRPLGAILFGYIGDVYGRRRSLFFSMTMMAVPSLIIALLPGYKTIGILAPIILMVSRIIQGLCTGGEYNSAAIYALESTKSHRGLVSGCMTASAILGISLASCLQFILQFVPGESWRFAFLLGTGIAFFGIYVRTQLLESPEFEERKIKTQQPLIEAVTDYKKQCLLTFFVSGQTAVLGYTLVAGGPSYLKLKGLIDLNFLPMLGLMGSLLMAASCVFFGYVSDYFGKNGNFIVLSSVLAILVLPFTFGMYASGNLQLIILGHSLLALLGGLDVSTQHRFYQSLFPAHLRCSAVSVFFSLGIGLLGASVPIWCVSFATPWILPAVYTLFTGWLVWQYAREGQTRSADF